MCCLQVSEQPLIHLDGPVQYDGCDLYECVVCRCLESHWFTWIAQSNDMIAVTCMNVLSAGVWTATNSPGWPSPIWWLWPVWMCCLQVSGEPLVHLDSPVQRYDGCDPYEMCCLQVSGEPLVHLVQWCHDGCDPYKCIVCRCLESHWFTWVAQSNHVPMDVKADEAEPWVKLQMHATCNVERSFFNDWFTGHLNFQIEHQ